MTEGMLVFEDKALADTAVDAVETTIQHGGDKANLETSDEKHIGHVQYTSVAKSQG